MYCVIAADCVRILRVHEWCGCVRIDNSRRLLVVVVVTAAATEFLWPAGVLWQLLMDSYGRVLNVLVAVVALRLRSDRFEPQHASRPAVPASRWFDMASAWSRIGDDAVYWHLLIADWSPPHPLFSIRIPSLLSLVLLLWKINRRRR